MYALTSSSSSRRTFQMESSTLPNTHAVVDPAFMSVRIHEMSPDRSAAW